MEKSNERLTLGGREFELKTFNLNDWIELGEKGVDFNKYKDGTAPTMKDLRTLIWVAVKKVDPAVTEEWVGEVLTIDAMTEVVNTVVNFINPSGTENQQPTG